MRSIAPLNRSGDSHGSAFKDGAVTMPRGFKEAYRAWTAAGWNALPGPEAYGGQGLPTLLNSACVEMWNSACMSFGLAPLLTMGGIEALAQHGSDELKDRYLAKLVSGEWTGDHEPDRAAGRLRPQRHPQPRRARPPTAPTGSPAARSSSPMASTT